MWILLLLTDLVNELDFEVVLLELFQKAILDIFPCLCFSSLYSANSITNTENLVMQQWNKSKEKYSFCNGFVFFPSFLFSLIPSFFPSFFSVPFFPLSFSFSFLFPFLLYHSRQLLVSLSVLIKSREFKRKCLLWINIINWFLTTAKSLICQN